MEFALRISVPCLSTQHHSSKEVINNLVKKQKPNSPLFYLPNKLLSIWSVVYRKRWARVICGRSCPQRSLKTAETCPTWVAAGSIFSQTLWQAGCGVMLTEAHFCSFLCSLRSALHLTGSLLLRREKEASRGYKGSSGFPECKDPRGRRDHQDKR